MDNEIVIREMTIGDYAQVMQLWSNTEGMGLSDADTQENINKFLKRNAGLSFVAQNDDQEIVGAILCGHDGRRGYLHHLAVNSIYRKKGIASNLITNSLVKLTEEGVSKCHLFVFTDNQQGMEFWKHMGFHKRKDINIFSKDI